MELVKGKGLWHVVVGDGAIKNQPRLFVTWVGEGEEEGGSVLCFGGWGGG